jgi:hypothetical protein
VADAAGLAVEQVRRYEGPVVAEREFIADQARATRVGRDTGAPVLGDLVTDRLAARGVDLSTLAWDAYRDASGPWTVTARFTVGEVAVNASWTYDAQARSVHALEDEARWLSETELADEPIQRRHLAAVRDVVFDVEADGVLRPVLTSVDGAEPGPSEPIPDPHVRTAALLDDLQVKRGIRQQVDLEDEDGEEFEGFGPQHAFDFGQLESHVPGAHPVDADPESAATVLSAAPQPGPEAASVSVEPPEVPAPLVDRQRSGRKVRASVPSWDEIVFGAKPE